MAKELKFAIAGTEYGAAPVKLERKKIYGWSDLVATDKSGDVCEAVYLSIDDALLIPSGGYKQGTVDDSGRWVEKGELTACDKDGNPLQQLASSFDAVIELKEKVSAEEFLDNDWDAVYQLVNPDLAAAIGNDIYIFDFCYRAGVNHNYGYLMNAAGGLFLFAGDKQEFPLLSLVEQTVIDEVEEVEEEIDELDFSMF